MEGLSPKLHVYSVDSLRSLKFELPAIGRMNGATVSIVSEFSSPTTSGESRPLKVAHTHRAFANHSYCKSREKCLGVRLPMFRNTCLLLFSQFALSIV